ncbi:trypsin-like serine protease [Fulvivirga sp. 29W222]|uniref:Serine protease n=1 Tax=Fulvivirga marina TaxID=2494733 RepID=A0A937KDE2_9BACT|nr:trypsin-like serine protease [Fulvivirga marina]MBL6448517.1 trypsin-like serine protease [Fulvivirga marina]
MARIIFVLLIATGFGCVSNHIQYGNYNMDKNARYEVVKDEEPFRYICHLVVHRRWGGPFPSTGFLVSDNVILTAGHSVGEYRKIFPNRIQSVEIKLFEYFKDTTDYRCALSVKLDRSEIEQIESHSQFKGKKSRLFDYGYIKLKTDILGKVAGGHFDLAEYESTGSASDDVFITGYPADLQAIKEGSLWNKGSKKECVTTSENYLTYGIYTHKGDSGAPVWMKVNDKYYVVGIHNTGYKTCNGGTKVTEDVIDYVKGIIAEKEKIVANECEKLVIEDED